jgi:phosphatidylinositol dimannoside acyltransferase
VTRPTRAFSDALRYATYRGLGEAMGRMSGPVAQRVASGVARAVAWRGGGAVDINERHLWRVLASECADGVEPDPDLVRRWSRRAFSAYGRYWADGARLPFVDPAEVQARFRLEEGDDHLRAAWALGRGIVMALPHVGSWEWGGAWLALEGMPMTAVVEPVEPQRLFEWFLAQRASMGLTAVPLGEGSSAAMLRTLKNGEVAGLVSDRDLAGNGIEVEFFGERTTMPGGAATLALRSGAPLVPVVVYSGPGDWHTGVVHPPLDTERRGTLRADVARLTQELATLFEHDIRRHPEQWHLFQPNWPDDVQPNWPDDVGANSPNDAR